MKRYTDYEPAELAKLEDDSILTLIEIEIATEGIIPVEAPQLLPVPPVDLDKTMEAVECRGILFENAEDAMVFQKMKVLHENYSNATGGYSYKFLQPEAEGHYNTGIETKKFYDKQILLKVQELLTERDRIQTINNEAEDEFSSYQKSTREIRSKVWAAVHEARDEMQRIERAKEVYQKHLILADGDERIADNFFFDAYNSNYPQVMEAVRPGIAEQIEARREENETVDV